MITLNRVLVVAIACALAHPGTHPTQDADAEFTAKVVALADQMRTGPAPGRKKAEEELLKLGPRAVPVLRKEFDKSEGEFRGRLEGVILKIERESRRRAALGRTLDLKIAAEKRPLKELAAEWQTATNVPIEVRGGAEDALVTLDAPSVNLWLAIDRVCKSNGKLTWDVSDKGVVIDAESYAPPPFAVAGGYVVVVREFERRSSDSPGGKRMVLSSGAYVAGPPGTVLSQSFMTYEALVDDRGANLLKGGGPTFKTSTGFYTPLPDWKAGRFLYESISDLHDPVASKDSTRVKVCRGAVFVRAIMDYKKAVELRGPAIKRGAKVSSPGVTLAILENTSSGSDVRMEIEITDSLIDGKKERNVFYPESGGRVILRDSRGEDIGAKLDPSTGTSSHQGMGGASSETTRYTLTGTLKGEGSLSSFEIWDPSDIEETKVPFDLKEVPIRKSK